MGGRVYDPLAGRFTTADPIMQAPYWSQGQNRYAYVFNDPLNNTDPSGFMSSSDIAGGAAPGLIGGGITGGAYLATHSASLSGWGIGGGVAGGATNAMSTLLNNPFGGSGPGAFSVAAPSGTPNANPVKPGGTNAVGQGSAPRVVQEKGGRPSLFDRARGALAANESDSAVKNPFLKFEHKLDSSFKPVGPVELGDFSPGKAPDMGSAPRRTLDPSGPDAVTSVWDHNIKQKYLDELSKLEPSPGKYLLEQNKPLLKAQGKQAALPD